jgi:hypothetical protein
MLYSLLFLILSEINFIFMHIMRLNVELLNWLQEQYLDAILSEINKCYEKSHFILHSTRWRS